ncbi:Flp family type IVb pilin [Xenophilus sp. Marseille-Q4582]|uniref:Flp family type IVb pilin n=1 Tax=Xenophilus sp. Marseille-Q4582 TaxID=2866600 RepID=UPI001CE4B2F1|nr:Flp family type IVb pilin [Xenophilus sp. Marseille-Q4582]
MDKVLAFWNDEEGATAVEYGIIAGLMAIILVAVFAEDGFFGTALTTTFQNIANAMTGQ